MTKKLTIENKKIFPSLHREAMHLKSKTMSSSRASIASRCQTLRAYPWLKHLLQSGGHVGHRPIKLSLSRLCYFDTSSSLMGERGGGAVINPLNTFQQTIKGLHFAASVLRQRGHILVIDTRGEASPLNGLIEVHNRKIPASLSFSGGRWVGGTLTNWVSISRMMCRSAQISRNFEAFLRRNRIHIPRYEKMRQAYPGFLQIKANHRFAMPGVHLRLKRQPDLLFFTNPNENRHVIEEARTLKIPVMALVDSNTDLSHITVPIPINSDPLLWSNNIITTFIDLAASLPPVPQREAFSLRQLGSKRALGRR